MYRTLLIPLILAMGCANFQQKAGETLATVQATTVSAREVLLPAVDAMCRDLAEACRDAGDMECQPLQKCDEVRNHFIHVLVGIHFAVLDANSAVAIGAEKDAWAAIDRALALIAELRVQLKEFGIGG